MEGLEAVALVYFNLPSIAFLDLTPKQFFDLLTVKSEERLGIYKQDMERMRLQTYLLINIQLRQKDKIKSPKSLIGFAWDVDDAQKIQDTKQLTEDEWSKYDDNFNIGGDLKK